MFQLGERLGKTAGEILAMPAWEFAGWAAHFRLSAKESQRTDLRQRAQAGLGDAKKLAKGR